MRRPLKNSLRRIKKQFAKDLDFSIFGKIQNLYILLNFLFFMVFSGFQALGLFFLKSGGRTFFGNTDFHQNPSIFELFLNLLFSNSHF